ncbi:SDR family NAD(P)-dependent oxidoreductase [Pseudofrankia asymbiotica]|uniref:Short-chain dehydrogenase n=1 Tax=Pseudofrankia asymbiotica TaxID=1834516 RepID=A0A1V2I7L3_9ACTN|nr:SDR family oxidoreductase [Pseudofrankia asymbiotica]ONH28034.1 hypothetical protein BL253_20760 [Pseudofrankia asymbiotica]
MATPGTVFQPDTLAGRRALVTGGSRGIGAEIVTTLASIGAEVRIASNDAEGMERVVRQVKEAGGTASAVFVDLADRSAVADLAAANTDLDILVNNAAPDQKPIPFSATPDEVWDLHYTLNVFTPVSLIRTIAPAMAERGGGSVVCTSSISTHTPAPAIAPYASSKAAMETIIRVLAMEFGPRNVRCNAVAPSMTPTERIAGMLANPDFRARAVSRVPLGRLCEPSDTAAAVAWLCSDAAPFVNGQVIVVDGGATAGLFMPMPTSS